MLMVKNLTKQGSIFHLTHTVDDRYFREDLTELTSLRENERIVTLDGR